MEERITEWMNKWQKKIWMTGEIIEGLNYKPEIVRRTPKHWFFNLTHSLRPGKEERLPKKKKRFGRNISIRRRTSQLLREVRFWSLLFSRGHATLHLAVSVGRSVGRSVTFEFRAVFALLLLPNRPRLDCRVSGLVFLARDSRSWWSTLTFQWFCQ